MSFSETPEPPADPWSHSGAEVVAPRQRRRWSWLPAVLVALVVAAFGALLGVLWAQVAPRLAVIKVEGGFRYAEMAPEEPVAADGWFAIIGAAAGIIFALLAWGLLRRYRGVGMLLGLTLGSLASAVLAWYVGHKIGQAEFVAANSAAVLSDQLAAPLGLEMANLDQRNLWKSFPTGVAAAQALLAVFTYTFMAGFSPYPDLRDDDPAEDPAEDRADDAAEDPGETPGENLGPDPAENPGGNPGQFGPGFTGSSDNGMGTART